MQGGENSESGEHQVLCGRSRIPKATVPKAKRRRLGIRRAPSFVRTVSNPKSNSPKSKAAKTRNQASTKLCADGLESQKQQSQKQGGEDSERGEHQALCGRSRIPKARRRRLGTRRASSLAWDGLKSLGWSQITPAAQLESPPDPSAPYTASAGDTSGCRPTAPALGRSNRRRGKWRR